VSVVVFWVLAAILLGSAIAVVTAKSLFRAAFALAATLLATAGFYLLLSAPLLAAVQVLLYTGGVLTLTVFALVVAGDQTDGIRWRRPLPAAALALAVLAALGAAVHRASTGATPGGLESGRAVGTALFGDYLVPFELLSVLLLGAVFGALLLARKDRPE
jgi:NADH:ubiquinone oxidoreductase subunit 6 (subunit J)